MRLSWIPVLLWTVPVMMTPVDIAPRELEWRVWIIGLLTAAPVIVHAILIRRNRFDGR